MPSVNSTVEVYAAITKLHDTIKAQIEATNKNSRIMLWLTWVAAFLAFFQAFSASVQIWPIISRIFR